jgi:hypothetical protein
MVVAWVNGDVRVSAVAVRQQLVAAEVCSHGDTSMTVAVGNCMQQLQITMPGDSTGEQRWRLRVTFGCK